MSVCVFGPYICVCECVFVPYMCVCVCVCLLHTCVCGICKMISFQALSSGTINARYIQYICLKHKTSAHTHTHKYIHTYKHRL